jgi:hypothetical protein
MLSYVYCEFSKLVRIHSCVADADVTMDACANFLRVRVSGGDNINWHKINSNLKQVVDNAELQNSVKKRMSSRNALVGDKEIYPIVCLIIASSGYEMNHLSVKGTLPRTFAGIWEFLDTLRVSSSPPLRAILDSQLGTRNGIGYASEVEALNYQHTHTSSKPMGIKTTAEWTLMEGEKNIAHTTINHAILLDRCALMGKGISRKDTLVLF